MLKKEIKITINNEISIVKMSREEMLINFDNLFNQFAQQCMEKNKDYNNRIEDFDDYKQKAMIKALEKFETYDIRKGMFSTILFIALQGLIIDEIRKNEAKIRKAEYKPYYLDSQNFEEGECVANLVPDKTSGEYIINNSTDLEKFLIKNLTKEEMMFYTIDLKKRAGKASSIQKVCLKHTIEVFTKIIGIIPDKKIEIATLLGISRPTLNKRIKEAIDKVKTLTEEFCLCNMELSDLPF